MALGLELLCWQKIKVNLTHVHDMLEIAVELAIDEK